MQNILVLYSSANSNGKKDATCVFIPEAKEFAKIHKIPDGNCIGLPLTKMRVNERKDRVRDAIYCAGREKPLTGIVFFGHGWPTGFQFGFNRDDAYELADCIEMAHKNSTELLCVALYACLTGENQIRDNEIKNIGPATTNGFADILRKELRKSGIKKGTVDAHKTAGHSTYNPYVIRFFLHDTGIDTGGSWLVEPASEYWLFWKRALRNTDLRFRFPFMNELQIKSELSRQYKLEAQKAFNR